MEGKVFWNNLEGFNFPNEIKEVFIGDKKLKLIDFSKNKIYTKSCFLSFF